MTYTVRYDECVAEDISRLDTRVRERIKRAIETKLQRQPEIFGKPLRRSLVGFRSLRVGNYRIVYLIEGKTVTVFLIGDRKFIYQEAMKRLKSF
jgi:mRNA interferase RelE/StbE